MFDGLETPRFGGSSRWPNKTKEPLCVYRIYPGRLERRAEKPLRRHGRCDRDNFGELVARRSDGALIGPFNGWLHFPQFGKPAWDFNKSLWEHSVLPAAIHQLVILVTAAKLGARYEIYGHEYFARRAGLAEHKIATIVAGERPSNLARDEGVAYDMAAALNRGGPLPSRPTGRRSRHSENKVSPRSSSLSAAFPWSA